MLATAHPVSLWQWMPSWAPVVPAGADDLADPRRQHAAVGVTQDDDLGARLGRGVHDLQRVRRVGSVAVEEVLAVDEDPHPLAPQVGDGVGHHRQVLPQRGLQGLLDVPVVGLGDDAGHVGPGVAQSGRERVVGRLHPDPAGEPERGQGGVPELDGTGGHLGEVGGVARVGPRPAALDVVHPEVVEQRGDRQLVVDGEIQALLLGPVPQRRVVHVERDRRRPGGGGHLLASSVLSGVGVVSGNKKPPAWSTGGRRAEGFSALGDNHQRRHEIILTARR